MMIRTHIAIFASLCLLHRINQHQLITHFVAALATLESGQRLLPRYQVNKFDERDAPTTVSTDVPYSVWNLPQVEQWAKERQLTQHHIKSVYRVATSYGGRGINDTTSNSASIQQNDNEWQLQQLQESGFPKMYASEFIKQFRLRTIRLHDIQYPKSSSGSSIKLVFQLPIAKNTTTSTNNDRFIETVLIRHDISGNDTFTTVNSRYTVCVSSQVGCARACTFCATGTQMKFQSQLSSSEIVEQVYMAQQVLNQIHKDNENPSEAKGQRLLRNIVFMGMGEPLDNWEEVYEACRTLTNQRIFGFSPKRITISTVGVSPNYIRQMAYDAPSLRLAISLHGATQLVRERLMPATKAEHATLSALESALDDHIKITGQYGGPMIEYLLIDDINDTDDAAQALIDFCKRRQDQQQQVAFALHKSSGMVVPAPSSYVNLIPYNPTLIGMNIHQYRTPSDSKIIQFHERLLQSGTTNYSIKSHVRWSSAASRDTNGACGQLALLSSSQRNSST